MLKSLDLDFFFRRVFAFSLDILIISFVANMISSSPVNFQLNDLKNTQKEYTELQNTYYIEKQDIKTCKDIDKILDKGVFKENFKDDYKKIDKELDDSDSLCKDLVNKYINGGMSEEQYKDKMLHILYNLEKYSIFNNILIVVLCLLYFVIFQGYTGGQTLGKKLSRVKLVNSDGSEVSYKKLFIRTLFLYNVMYYILYALIVLILPINLFVGSCNVVYIINYIYSAFMMFLIFVDKDKRGIHDFILKTKVIQLEYKYRFKKKNKNEKVEEEKEVPKNKKKLSKKSTKKK